MSIKDLENYRVSICALYFKAAYDSHRQYFAQVDAYEALKYQAETSTEELTPISEAMYQCELEKRKHAVISIAFCGMAIEAFFYDYASDALGDHFVEEHLDKLDLKSKFLIYPRLICGTEPDKSRKGYGSLVKLVKLRNELVHYKSENFHVSELDKASDHITKSDEKFATGVKECIGYVDDVMHELDALHDYSELFYRKMRSFVAG